MSRWRFVSSFYDDDAGPMTAGVGGGPRWAALPPSKTHERKMRGGCVSQGPSHNKERFESTTNGDVSDTARVEMAIAPKKNRCRLTCDSVGGFSSSLSGAAPREAPGRWSPVPIPRRLAKFSSRFALRISTCCSSRRRRSSSGLNVFFALNWVRRCSGMYRSAMIATCGGCNDACGRESREYQ